VPQIAASSFKPIHTRSKVTYLPASDLERVQLQVLKQSQRLHRYPREQHALAILAFLYYSNASYAATKAIEAGDGAA
jgi:hypothetical protein